MGLLTFVNIKVEKITSPHSPIARDKKYRPIARCNEKLCVVTGSGPGPLHEAKMIDLQDRQLLTVPCLKVGARPANSPSLKRMVRTSS
ncbi:hypothetical protein, partial [Rhizobium laguerreae]|uniref:hypothetical protein n=1 Tax=Rhizobium laguerreae TaxID=1076926 RepID=UPI001C8FB499